MQLYYRGLDSFTHCEITNLINLANYDRSVLLNKGQKFAFEVFHLIFSWHSKCGQGCWLYNLLGKKKKKKENDFGNNTVAQMVNACLGTHFIAFAFSFAVLFCSVCNQSKLSGNCGGSSITQHLFLNGLLLGT